MDYQALYRKYRPQRFAEVVGQDHVTNTLAREVVEGKIAHAYLFAGPRGTGKTTSARLLAKALNCENLGPEGEPDDTCPSCVGVREGTSLDVIELDAASHNKVEDIREIRINVGTVAAAAGARRVYILDEAHMLSRAAGNALLKTLEEPPEHVVFVLATTEPYKLLDTIRSRSQRFDFHPVPNETLVDYMQLISDREGFKPDATGLATVATHSGGSVRDALSLLEQVAALGQGSVTAELAGRALGLADSAAFDTLAAAVQQQDAPAALGLVARLASQGADLRRFVSESIGFFRGIFLAQYSPNLEEVADEPAETLADWRRHGKELTPAEVLRAVDILGEALHDVRQGREERLVIELALLRLTRPETSPDVDALTARIGRLEAQIRELQRGAPPAKPDAAGASIGSATNDVVPAPPSAPKKTEPTKTRADDEASTDEPTPADADESEPSAASPSDPGPVADIDLRSFETVWPQIVARVREELGPRRHALLKEAVPVSAEDGVVTLHLPDHLPFHLEQLQADQELQGSITSIAADSLAGSITLAFGSSTAAPVAVTDPDRAPDKAQMLEEGEDETDPTALVVDILGGEIVSE
ncbi:MAG: DNA polymerase III subunit gamma/tau [Acidimicrobiia bacterium]|nr:DNA polymerase III subunit gamma/tau [Acidimicrobiia bacterium]